MDAERWRQVRDLFLAVCDLDPSERGDHLDQACGNDADLREDIEAILNSSEPAASFFDHSSIDLDRRAVIGELPADRRIGPYRLVEVIASGGMGTVYRAERDDGQYKKTVAVKLIRAGMLDPEGLRRFRNERQTLARLEHPNIAHLLDGGVSDDGIPFLVMEYVAGKSIDAYCDEHRLSTTRRIELFLDVCSAVHYAHRNLIVHRDLKPGNILVTAEGVPKLLDFGIAKVLHRAGAEEVTLQRAMTPEYASPEQIQGDPVTTAGDIYSLGVVLYKLLTGHTPFRLKSGSIGAFERTVLEVEPLLPSSVIWRVDDETGQDGRSKRTVTPESVSEVREGTPKRLSRCLAGDLDNIVLMAMRKEPHRRYATAERLAEDLENYLANRPVLARRDTFLYRTAKFARRHWVGLVASILIVVSILTGVVGIAREAQKTAKQRDEALAAGERADAVVAFLEKTLTSVRPGEAGPNATVRSVLDAAASRVETDFDAEPSVKGFLHRTIGRSYASLGLHAKAERQLRKALAIHRGLADEPAAEIESLNDLGSVLFSRGALDEAESLLREALVGAREILGNEHVTTIRIKVNLGDVLGEYRDLAEAERLHREALAARRVALGPVHLEVAESLDRLAGLAVLRGNLDEAVRSLEEAIDIQREILGEENPLVMDSRLSLAAILQEQGRHEEAIRLYEQAEPGLRQALEIHQGMLGSDHLMTISLIDKLGELLHAKGRLDEAAVLFRQAMDGCIRLTRKDPRQTVRARMNLATTRHNLAKVLLDQGRLDDAESLFRAALAARRELWASPHLDVADTLARLGETVRRRGDPAEAARYLDEALQIRLQLLDEHHPLIRQNKAQLKRVRVD